MSNDAESVPVAAPALVGAGALIAFTLLAVAVGRTGGVGITEKPEANPVASLALTVEDRSDGAITLHEAGSDRLVALVAPGQDGFLRATLRGFGQARLRAGHGRAEPFRLTRYDDGSLTLSDEATGRRVNLEAFGATNAGAFAKLLPETLLPEGSTIR
ncbi:photosynthetic complex assembly protein PuhC [Methylobacterium segetis]|uniref:photosynthetic complex assembly protein PuhC n=1 Tax=Methylobacterium segetis TaxID=2488750 RepID=UPI0010532127|nr:photosynthetic complex assembly protein PuhC [Methylobacterium segetis]